MPKIKDTKAQEAQMIESSNLIEGENFQKDIEDIMGIIDDVESNMKEDKLSSQFKASHKYNMSKS